VPELAYPLYQLQADGPNETGCRITLSVSDGVGGPLPGTTARSVVEGLKAQLQGDTGDVSVLLTLQEIRATEL
jgi:hypothetical protein